jgi:hypothetical protein
VTPVLYREPVVQDLGLLIRGIERPLANGLDLDHAGAISSDEEVPLHKLHVLALVKNLHLVHASSRTAVTPEFRTINKPHEFPSSDLCDVDVLGRMDLDGMKNAYTIAERARKVHGESFPIFQNVEHLTLGSWDDGRWSTYYADFRRGLNGRAVLPDNELPTIVAQLEPSLSILRSRVTCRRLEDGLYSGSPPSASKNTDLGRGPGMNIIHATSIDDKLDRSYEGLTRIYIDIAFFVRYNDNLSQRSARNLEPFKSYGWLLHRMSSYRMTDTEPASAVPSLELCLVSRDGDHWGLDLALEVKEALDKYRKDVLDRKGKDRIRHGGVRILVGDEVPVCPCCGMTSMPAFIAGLHRVL